MNSLPTPVTERVRQLALDGPIKAIAHLVAVTGCDRRAAEKLLAELVPEIRFVSPTVPFTQKPKPVDVPFVPPKLSDVADVAPKVVSALPAKPKPATPKPAKSLKSTNGDKLKTLKVKVASLPYEQGGDVPDAELASMGCDWLRKYATHVLSIPRASKIPGGIPVLVEKIIEARRR